MCRFFLLYWFIFYQSDKNTVFSIYQALLDSGFTNEQIANMAEEDIIKAVAPYGIKPVPAQVQEQFDLGQRKPPRTQLGYSNTPLSVFYAENSLYVGDQIVPHTPLHPSHVATWDGTLCCICRYRNIYRNRFTFYALHSSITKHARTETGILPDAERTAGSTTVRTVANTIARARGRKVVEV